MDIYPILASKPHNKHMLKRYIRFISGCQQKNVGHTGFMERHHICPKAEDMFPHYTDLRQNPWNEICLTPRQHYIAHMILWKTFMCYSQTVAFNLMIQNENMKSSVLYQKLREDYHNELRKQKSQMSKRAKVTSKRMLDDGSHPFLQETLIKENRERMQNDNPMKKIRINSGSFKKGNNPVITEDRNRKISLSKTGEKNQNFGKVGLFDHINKVLLTCQHCGIETTKGNIVRWHNDNCRHRLSEDFDV